MVKTRIRNYKRVFTWFVSRRPQTPAEASLEASLKIQRPHGAGRPCYEADDSACRGEWRRETGSPRKGARLMLVREREIGELPSPICPCLAERSGGDLMFSEQRFAGYANCELSRNHGDLVGSNRAKSGKTSQSSVKTCLRPVDQELPESVLTRHLSHGEDPTARDVDLVNSQQSIPPCGEDLVWSGFIGEFKGFAHTSCV